MTEINHTCLAKEIEQLLNKRLRSTDVLIKDLVREIKQTDVPKQLVKEIEQLLDEHLYSADLLKQLAKEIEQLLDEHLHSADVLEYLAKEIEQLLYHRLLRDRERLGRSVGFLA